MTPKIRSRKGLFFTLTYSPDDNGYYANIFNKTGEDLHTTEVRSTWSRTFEDVMEWIDETQRDSN